MMVERREVAELGRRSAEKRDALKYPQSMGPSRREPMRAGELGVGEVRVNPRSLNREGEKNYLVSEHNKQTGRGREEMAGEAETKAITVVSERDSQVLARL